MWASASGWDQKSLMSCVGWRDAKSALRYVECVRIFLACSARQRQRRADRAVIRLSVVASYEALGFEA